MKLRKYSAIVATAAFVLVGSLGTLILTGGATTASASSTSLQKWVHSEGPHLRAVVADGIAIISDTSATTNAAAGDQCRTLESDVTYLEGSAKVPNRTLQKALHKILGSLAPAGLRCQAAMASNNSQLAGTAALVITDGLTSLGKLGKEFKKDGASLATGPTIHHTVPTTTVPTNHVGDTLSTSTIAVQLQQVIDPAQSSNQYLTPDAGNRFVGVKVQITNPGPANVQDDANNDITAIGSNGQIYTADFDTIAGCTNFNDGDYGLTSKASAVGCVTFQIPTGVAVTKVDFVGSNSRAEWNVP